MLTEDAPGAYSFVHDLFREFAYQRLPAGSEARLHSAHRPPSSRRTGRAARIVPLAELAGHFVQADPGSAQAYEYSAAAAREADGRLAYEEAARHWERALAARLARTRRPGPRRCSSWPRRAGAWARARRRGDLPDRRRAGPPRTRCRRAGARRPRPARDRQPDLVACRPAGHGPVGGPGRAPGGPGRRPAPAARHGGSLARVLAWHGLDLPRARALAAEAVTQARAAGDVPALAACLLAQHNALWAPGTAGERRAVAAEVAALAERDRRP